jgi:hypothetical protein
VPGEPIGWQRAPAVWVNGRRLRKRIDPATNQVVANIEVPPLRTVPACNGGVVDASSAGDSVWATAYDDNVLYRIRPD